MLCVDWFARKKLQLVEGIEALFAHAQNYGILVDYIRGLFVNVRLG